MRKHLRDVARHKMQRSGLTRIHKKGADGRSFFACNWRKYAK